MADLPVVRGPSKGISPQSLPSARRIVSHIEDSSTLANLISSYQAFRLGGDDPLTLDVPVPARQVESSGTCPVNPIHGKRVLVKDCFEIKGLQTTVGSRAYFELASRAEITAAAIQVLIDRGAALVGQAKLSALISREEPSECVDYDAAFNPRGDGIQSPAGSSSGSAAAIAAYDWLDYAIGTDCKCLTSHAIRTTADNAQPQVAPGGQPLSMAASPSAFPRRPCPKKEWYPTSPCSMLSLSFLETYEVCRSSYATGVRLCPRILATTLHLSLSRQTIFGFVTVDNNRSLETL